MFKKIRRYLRSPYYAFGDDLIKSHPHWMSDEYFIKVFWLQMMGYPLDLTNPKTFNEKIQWMKLYDRNPLYTDLVDKLKVKDWVANKIGQEHIIPTLAVYNSVDEIRLDELPDQFVLKCNHDSGGIVICRDKSTFDFEGAKAKLKKCFEHNFYWDYREWAYKNVERKIFAEQLMQDSSLKDDLPDYKIFTFSGEPKLIEVDFDRFKQHKRNVYDTNWNYLDVMIQYPNQSSRIFEKPNVLKDMLSMSSMLAESLPMVRTDFYIIDNHVYFGEMTFYHDAGYDVFKPESLGVQMGDWIKLPDKKC